MRQFVNGNMPQINTGSDAGGMASILQKALAGYQMGQGMGGAGGGAGGQPMPQQPPPQPTPDMMYGTLGGQMPPQPMPQPPMSMPGPVEGSTMSPASLGQYGGLAGSLMQGVGGGAAQFMPQMRGYMRGAR